MGFLGLTFGIGVNARSCLMFCLCLFTDLQSICAWVVCVGPPCDRSIPEREIFMYTETGVESVSSFGSAPIELLTSQPYSTTTASQSSPEPVKRNEFPHRGSNKEFRNVAQTPAYSWRAPWATENCRKSKTPKMLHCRKRPFSCHFPAAFLQY